MKKTTLLHVELSGLIAGMGHGDLLVLGDAGLPVPPGVRLIDLAVTRNVPRFLQVLDAVLAELQVERAAFAAEAGAVFAEEIGQRIPEVIRPSHTEFKEISRQARAIVRTGECTPYANIALWSGVTF